MEEKWRVWYFFLAKSILWKLFFKKKKENQTGLCHLKQDQSPKEYLLAYQQCSSNQMGDHAQGTGDTKPFKLLENDPWRTTF